MSAKKIQNENTLLIEWGTLTRSEAVEKHITTKAQKILDRAKDATHLIVSLSSEVCKNNHALDVVKVHFELRFPRHQDLFCQSEGHNLYEVLADCNQVMLRQIQDRKSIKIHRRSEGSFLKSL